MFCVMPHSQTVTKMYICQRMFRNSCGDCFQQTSYTPIVFSKISLENTKERRNKLPRLEQVNEIKSIFI